MKIYPEEVEQRSSMILKCVIEFLLEDTTYTEEWCTSICMPIINELLLPKFINGEDLVMTEDEAKRLITDMRVTLAFRSLEEKGLINVFEDDENGEIAVLTPKGKEYGESIFGKKRP
jgi:hypothetical protein